MKIGDIVEITDVNSSICGAIAIIISQYQSCGQKAWTIKRMENNYKDNYYEKHLKLIKKENKQSSKIINLGREFNFKQ